MMRFKTLITLIFGGVLACLSASAQELSTLKTASEIQTGELPNGVSYYLVTNNTSKGYANFALVQKEQSEQKAARAHLKSLPHFVKPAPYTYLASRGVGYKRYGYISYPAGSTVFSLEDVPIFDSVASDSTLLLIFDLIQTSDAPQAIIVSGDISGSALYDKIRMLALTTLGQRPTAQNYREHEWKPSERLKFTHTQNSTKNVAGVQVVYTSPRPPKEYLNTTQPLVTKMYSTILGYILQKRASKIFADAGVPLADTYYRYTSSSESAGDEKYRFTVFTGVPYLEKATSVLAGMLADLDVHGAGLQEYKEARSRLSTEAASDNATNLSNREYVQKCVSAFLYGTSLASTGTMGELFSKRQMDPEKELELFNRFISAILDPEKGLTLNVQTPSRTVDKDEFTACFREGWNPSSMPPETIYGLLPLDTLKLFAPKGSRARIKSEDTDPITGGKLWTFSNGMRVIFKNTDTKGELHYAFMFNGGLPAVRNLKTGESAFVADMARFFNVSGISPSDFRNILQNNGIYYDLELTLTDMRIVGSAPTNKLQLLLKSLLSFDRYRTPAREGLDYYRLCETYRQERERLSQKGIKAAIDSMMAPDFKYPVTKNIDFFSDDLLDRVDEYFDDRFANAADGIIVLVGNYNEAELKKLLCRYIGQFKTTSERSRRPKVQYDLRNGWFTYTTDAAHSNVGTGETIVNFAMAAQRPFSMRTYTAFRVAALAIKKSVVAQMAEKGYTVSLSTDVKIFPSEKVSLMISCRPCLESGLPSGIKAVDPLVALNAVRMGVLQVTNTGISEAELKGYKAALLNDMTAEYEDPESLVGITLLRYSEGRDIVSNYTANVNAVSVADVKAALKDLDSGCKIEYVIK